MTDPQATCDQTKGFHTTECLAAQKAKPISDPTAKAGDMAETIVRMGNGAEWTNGELRDEIAAALESHHQEMVSKALSEGTLWTQEQVREFGETEYRRGLESGNQCSFKRFEQEGYERGRKAGREEAVWGKGECGHTAEFFICNKCVEVAEKEARQAALEECQKTHIALEDKWHKAGYEDGLEEAAKMADLHSAQSFGYTQEIRMAMKDLADRIRRLAGKDNESCTEHHVYGRPCGAKHGKEKRG